MRKRKPVVGMMGGSKAKPEVAEMAERLGELIAKSGWILLNGGRNKGVMAASARGAKKVGGIVVGIVPDKNTKKATPDLDIVVCTGMGDARNVINVLSSDVVIACPGSLGTLSEIVLAVKAKKHVILLGYDKPPSKVLEKFQKTGQLTLANAPEDAVAQAAAALDEMDIA
jgi:uncharacterized protein (TIGR00725 family)